MSGDVEVVIERAGSRALFAHGQWQLMRSMALQELRSRYRQSTLALSWSLVQPMLLVAVYALFFKGILDVNGGSVPYLSFIIAGLVPWRFIVNGLGATAALTDQVHVISKVYFPRELVPMANTAVGLVDLLIGTFLMLIVAAVQGYPPTVHLMALPVIYLLLVMVTSAVAVFATTLAVFVRDVSHGMPMVLQLAFFASPIMYTSDQLPSWLSWLTEVNPVAVVVNESRVVLFEDSWPNWGLLAVHLVTAAGLLTAAIAYVRSVEHRLVDVA